MFTAVYLQILCLVKLPLLVEVLEKEKTGITSFIRRAESMWSRMAPSMGVVTYDLSATVTTSEPEYDWLRPRPRGTENTIVPPAPRS